MQNPFQHDFIQYKLTTNTNKNWVVGGRLFMSVLLNTWSQQPKLAYIKPVTIFKILYPKPAYLQIGW